MCLGGLSVAPVRVLAVGSDRGLLALVRAALPPDRYAVEGAESIDAALGALFARRPDLIVVTSRPDGTDGTAVCRELQAVAELPVIMLVPHGETIGAVRGLTCADDYVALPVAPEEVEARVRAVLRRASRSDGLQVPAFDDGRLRVDFRDRVATMGGGPLPLTPTEYRLLALLAANPRRVFPQRELLRRVWGEAYAEDAHLLRLHVANLRKKIEGPGGHEYIRTHRGLGYSFQPAAERR
jgi:DNA-binding response OmpR family regulator